MRRELPGRAPTGTYRVQLTPEHGFARLGDQAEHLSRLGVSHAYLSPVLQSAPGSLHGYDVVDHDHIDVELGGEDGLRAAAAALAARGVRLLVDLVPNHMALTTPEHLNAALWGALRDGPDSAYARWFDVDWDRRLLMPVLGRRIDECLDAGEITLDLAGGPDGRPVVRYLDHVLPVRAGTQDLGLEDLLSAQYYRLAYWRVADEELNYRRFFDVDTLLAIKVEDPEVFRATHQVPVRLVQEGVISGLRIDHPDGLADPAGYLQALALATGGAYVVVEKILLGDEQLPDDWACDGTTGYDALRRIGALFVDPAGEPVLRGAFAEFTGVTDGWEATAERGRRDVLRGQIVAEVDRLSAVAGDICDGELRLRDHSRRGLTEALYELLAAVPVYRAYVTPGRPPPPASVRQITVAKELATARRPGRASEIALLADLALGRRGRSEQKDEFCRRFQQTSGPAIAKGVEDTACYRWFPLSALNEVGGDPDQFGISPAEFHEWAERRRADWPYSLNAMSTHDNKRSEDVRARLAVLSEIPGEWVTTVRAWRQASGPILTVGPDPALDNAATSDERLGWLAWQTLVGAWPLDAERLSGYLVKAAREAKLVTSWKSPDEGVEADIVAFVDRVLADEPLMGSVAQAVERLHPGFVANVLGQRAVQLFMPGVPDIYQGCEIVDLHLVDPDNRRCSDAVVLDEALVRGIAGVREPAVDLDAAKARLTATGLQVLRDRPDLVGPDAAHTAVGVEGQGADHVVAFTRGSDVVVLVTRFALRLAASGGWADTTVALPAGRWRELLQPRTMEFMEPSTPVADVLDHWPVAVLVREGA